MNFLTPFVQICTDDETAKLASEYNYGSFDGQFPASIALRNYIEKVRLVSCQRFGLDPANYRIIYWGSKKHMYEHLFLHLGDHFAQQSGNLKPYVTLFEPNQIADQFKKSGRLGINRVRLGIDGALPKAWTSHLTSNTILCCVKYDTDWGYAFENIQQIASVATDNRVPTHVDLDMCLISETPILTGAMIVSWTIDKALGPTGHVFGLVHNFINLPPTGVEPHYGLHKVWENMQFETPVDRKDVIKGMAEYGKVTTLAIFETLWIHDLTNELFWVIVNPNGFKASLCFFIVYRRYVIDASILRNQLIGKDILIHTTSTEFNVSPMTENGLKNIICLGLHQADDIKKLLSTMVNCVHSGTTYSTQH